MCVCVWACLSQADPQQQQPVRFADVNAEPLKMLSPITGLAKLPKVPLMDAVAAMGLDEMVHYAFVATERGAEVAEAGDPHGLDGDEAGSLVLYTMESPLYARLNQLLRDQRRQALQPFLPYLKLMHDARGKLPKFAGTVWRGVKGLDLRAQYPKDKEVYWWAFSSATKSLEALTRGGFLGYEGPGTLFNIEVHSAVDITKYSVFDAAEEEVLLYPGVKLRVVSTLGHAGQLFIVHLREVLLPSGVHMMS